MNKLLRHKTTFWIFLSAAALCLGNALYIDAKAFVAQQMIASAWAKTIELTNKESGTHVVKPWSWADTWPVAKLTNPDGQSFYVLNSTSGEALAFGPAHLQASASPGETGNIVIAGHRDTHFKFMQHVELSDEFVLQDSKGNEYTYRVEHIRIADSRTEQIKLHSNYPELELVSCYPFNQPQAGGPLRYIVTALPV